MLLYIVMYLAWPHSHVIVLSYKQHHWYARLSLLKYDFQMAKIRKWLQYDFQMAKIRKWLHAIWDYMKKVKSSISMVPPTHSHAIWLTYTWLTIKRPKVWMHGHFYKDFVRILVHALTHVLRILCILQLTSCKSKKLDQTPLICLTSPSLYNPK